MTCPKRDRINAIYRSKSQLTSQNVFLVPKYQGMQVVTWKIKSMHALKIDNQKPKEKQLYNVQPKNPTKFSMEILK